MSNPFYFPPYFIFEGSKQLPQKLLPVRFAYSFCLCLFLLTRSLFQYCDLHSGFGQVIGSPGFRGIHFLPQRRQVKCGRGFMSSPPSTCRVSYIPPAPFRPLLHLLSLIFPQVAWLLFRLSCSLQADNRR